MTAGDAPTVEDRGGGTQGTGEGSGRAAAGALVAQGTVAATSVVLNVVAARSLGAAGYGTFTVLLAGLLLLAAVHGGWVGDTRTVLDRHDPVVRGALRLVSALLVSVGAAGAFLASFATGVLDVGGAAAFGLLVVAWVVEDARRRLLMARLAFWSLAVNDVAYAAATLAALAALAALLDGVTLEIILVSMGVGAATAVGVARAQLPAAELASGPVTGAGLRQVVAFGGWRAAHAGTRPLATLVLRTLLRTVASAAALGRLEAARLLVAPLVVAANGLGTYLLPWAVRHRGSARAAPRAVVLAVAATGVAYVAAVTAVAPAAGELLTGGLEVERVAVAGWGAFALAFAAGLPAGSAVLARGRSDAVFRIRALDSAVGLALAAGLGWVAVGLAPWGLALGAALGAALLWSRADTRPRAGLAAGAG